MLAEDLIEKVTIFSSSDYSNHREKTSNKDRSNTNLFELQINTVISTIFPFDQESQR